MILIVAMALALSTTATNAEPALVPLSVIKKTLLAERTRIWKDPDSVKESENRRTLLVSTRARSRSN